MTSDSRPRTPVRDDIHLTRRQREVIDLMAKGYTNARIGESLGISLDGAKWHVSEILTVLNVDSREQAVEAWREQGRLDRRVRRSFAALSPSMAWVGAAAAVVVVIGVALVLWAALSAGGDGDVPASPDLSATVATASPEGQAPTVAGSPDGGGSPTAGAIALPAAGAVATANLLVYADEVRTDTDANGVRAWPVVDVVTYDLDAGQQAASFEVGAVGDYLMAHDMALVGRRIVIPFETHVDIANLDGGARRTIYEVPDERVITGIRVSPDGSMVAIGMEGVDISDTSLAQMVVVDLETGGVIQSFSHDTLTMPPLPLWWFGDGSAVVYTGYYHRGGSSPMAVAELDGDARRLLRRIVAMDPTGRHALVQEGESLFVCMGEGAASGGQSVIDVQTGDVIAEIAIDGYALASSFWSPDGTEAMVMAFPIDGQLDDGRSCVDSVAYEYFLWNRAGGTVEPVANLEGVLSRWEADRYIQIACAGEVQERLYPEHLQLTCSSRADRQPALLLDGEWIADVEVATIVGFADAP